MAKANLTLPDGTKVKIDGSAEEVALMISKLSQPSVTHRRKEKPTKKKGSKLKQKAKRPSIVKDLNLRSKGKKTFEQFFQEKKPKVGDQTYAVCVYYLEKILNVKGITQNHIYTCMKEVKRSIPNNLENALLISASRYSSIDTSDLSNITITVQGENLVEHKLAKE